MASPEVGLEEEIAHLRDIDLPGLRARWQSVFRGKAPEHLPRHLLLRIIAYRLQAERFGDLDQATRKILARVSSGGVLGDPEGRAGQNGLSPGTVMVREWNGTHQRVMVLADGFAWNGSTYRSLSDVAFAITGTRWSGPRFFGVRQRSESPACR